MYKYSINIGLQLLQSFAIIAEGFKDSVYWRCMPVNSNVSKSQ